MYPHDPVRKAIRAALNARLIIDVSYGNDVAPSYIAARDLDAFGGDVADDVARLWVDDADPNAREYGPGTPRLMVLAGNGDHPTYIGEFDAPAAIDALLERAAARCSCGTIPAYLVASAETRGLHRCHGPARVVSADPASEPIPAVIPASVTVGRTYTATERAYWLASAIAAAKAEITRDIQSRRVPSDVATFSRLHDYVDANEYGGLCDGGAVTDLSAPHTDDGINFCNTLQAAIESWLQAGRPVDRA